MWHKKLLFEEEPYLADLIWLRERFERLPTERISLKISEWAEKNRYLSSELTDNPGPWDNTYAPFTVEIMNRLSPEDPARDVVVQKAGQMMITTAVIENWLGFIIDHAPGPSMYVSGSKDLAKNSVEIKLDKMIASSGVEHKLKRVTRGSRSLSGNTTARKDFSGGFLLAYGGRSTAAMRAIGIRNMAVDEVDELPPNLGNQGSTIQLIRSRQRAFDKNRKTLFVSTPILKGGMIDQLYEQGDQRKFWVPCKFCGFYQLLKFRGKLKNGKRYGIYYELEKDGTLIFSSVGYRCKNCLKDWRDIDKYDFLNAGEWRPSSKPINPFFFSYYLDGLYSPEYSWESLVAEWLNCWDHSTQRVKDINALRVFENTARGRGWEERGESPRFERVIQFRRQIYNTKEKLPNLAAIKETGSPILCVTAGADVHKNNISVEVKGWCVNSCSYSIDWLIFEGDTENLQSPAWEKFRDLIENGRWVADDGKIYNINLTLIDASYRTDEVYRFCAPYGDGLYPIMGRDMPPKNASLRQFSSYTKQGLTAYNVTVTIYKDRIAGWLRRDWAAGEKQPFGYPNFPQDYRDDYFRQFEAEEKREKVISRAKNLRGFVWQKRKESLPNHAWDCFIYNAAGLDMLCYQINLRELGQDRIDYLAFWQYIEENERFFSFAA